MGEDLSPYSEAEIRNAWKQHRMTSGYFPYVSDLKKFLDFHPEQPKAYIGFTEEEKRLADEAKDSPEALKFKETLAKFGKM